jgi:O-antigen/teichoic acid export membrane protein
MQKLITKDLLAYLPAKALPALAAFITVPIYTRLFSPAEFGSYVLAVAAAELLLLVVIEGFGLGAIRFYSTYQRRSGLSSYFAVVFGSVGLITLVATAASAGILATIRSLIPSDLYLLLWAALALFVVSACFTTLTNVPGARKSLWYSVFEQCIIRRHPLRILLVLVFGMDMAD